MIARGVILARDALVRRAVSHLHAQRREPPRAAWMPRSPASGTVEVVDAETGSVRTQSPRPRVLILGAGPSHRQAPLDDPRYEVWSCNDLSAIAVDRQGRFRADRWFDLHPNDATTRWRRAPGYWAWLSTMPIPLYQIGRRDASQSLEFPMARAIAAGRDYFACTPAYQIALALAEGFRHVALYGVDLLSAREATVERATVEWWCGWAAGRGVVIELPPAPVPGYPIRMGTHPGRYGGEAVSCEWERQIVERWVRICYRSTLRSFALTNRPPETILECARCWWKRP